MIATLPDLCKWDSIVASHPSAHSRFRTPSPYLLSQFANYITFICTSFRLFAPFHLFTGIVKWCLSLSLLVCANDGGAKHENIGSSDAPVIHLGSSVMNVKFHLYLESNHWVCVTRCRSLPRCRFWKWAPLDGRVIQHGPPPFSLASFQSDTRIQRLWFWLELKNDWNDPRHWLQFTVVVRPFSDHGIMTEMHRKSVEETVDGIRNGNIFMTATECLTVKRAKNSEGGRNELKSIRATQWIKDGVIAWLAFLGGRAALSASPGAAPSGGFVWLDGAHFFISAFSLYYRNDGNEDNIAHQRISENHSKDSQKRSEGFSRPLDLLLYFSHSFHCQAHGSSPRHKPPSQESLKDSLEESLQESVKRSSMDTPVKFSARKSTHMAWIGGTSIENAVSQESYYFVSESVEYDPVQFWFRAGFQNRIYPVEGDPVPFSTRQRRILRHVLILQ